MNTSPKSRFLAETNLAKQFLDVVDSEAFQRASELAMIALMEESKSLDEIKGAQRFLAILKSLPEQPKLPPARTQHTLNHDLK